MATEHPQEQTEAAGGASRLSAVLAAQEVEMRESRLEQGRIPAHTECPFKGECSDKAIGLCAHKGEAHTVPFSCGFARAFDLIQKKAANIGIKSAAKQSPLE